MSNPLRVAEWRKVHNEDYPSVEAAMEAYAAYLLSELEREFEAKLDAIHDVDALIHWASESAEAVAAFRKRVMGE